VGHPRPGRGASAARGKLPAAWHLPVLLHPGNARDGPGRWPAGSRVRGPGSAEAEGRSSTTPGPAGSGRSPGGLTTQPGGVSELDRIASASVERSSRRSPALAAVARGRCGEWSYAGPALPLSTNSTRRESVPYAGPALPPRRALRKSRGGLRRPAGDVRGSNPEEAGPHIGLQHPMTGSDILAGISFHVLPAQGMTSPPGSGRGTQVGRHQPQALHQPRRILAADQRQPFSVMDLDARCGRWPERFENDMGMDRCGVQGDGRVGWLRWLRTARSSFSREGCPSATFLPR
jgi:hypothetical protein